MKGSEVMKDMPNAAETIERLSRESERQKIKIEQQELEIEKLQEEIKSLKCLLEKDKK